MELITTEQREEMLSNWRAAEEGHRFADGGEIKPVVKLFCPWGAATWLLTELRPEAPNTAFGLCDLGFGEPELGYVDLEEVASIRGPGGLTIERDLYWTAEKTLNDYAEEARRLGYIRT